MATSSPTRRKGRASSDHATISVDCARAVPTRQRRVRALYRRVGTAPRRSFVCLSIAAGAFAHPYERLHSNETDTLALRGLRLLTYRAERHGWRQSLGVHLDMQDCGQSRL